MTITQMSYAVADGVAEIRLDRPDKRNAISAELADQLSAAFVDAEGDTNVRCILVAANGKAFCAGVDTKNPPPDYRYLPGIGVPVAKPVVAAVQGWCVGAGIGLVQMVDLCVAADTARFAYPEGYMGLTQGLASSLAARIPHKVAMEVLLLGQALSAERAYDVGFVNAVTPEGEHVEAARRMATRIAEMPPKVAALMKAYAVEAIGKSPGEVALTALHELNRDIPANRPWTRTGAGTYDSVDLG